MQRPARGEFLQEVGKSADHSGMTSRRDLAMTLVLSAMLAGGPAASVSASVKSDALRASFREGAMVMTRFGPEFYEDALFGSGDDFVVATITAVRDQGATQARPPRVTARVDRTLRGDLQPGLHEIEWLPKPLFMPCPMGEAENIAAWERTPLAGPVVGSRLILAGKVGASGLWGANVWARFADEPDTRQVVEERIRAWQPRHEAWRKAWTKPALEAAGR